MKIFPISFLNFHQYTQIQIYFFISHLQCHTHNQFITSLLQHSTAITSHIYKHRQMCMCAYACTWNYECLRKARKKKFGLCISLEVKSLTDQ